MKTSFFDFSLPPERIAAQPVSPRDAARMLVVSDNVYDKKILNILEYLKAGDVMVFNNTKVIPARLFAKRGNADIEILLHKKIGQGKWQCFARPAKRLKIGDQVRFSDDFMANVEHKFDDGQVLLNFLYSDAEFWQKLEKYGSMPLPPYIERNRAADISDNASYQTVYAKHAGSVAAPTAGLHFTEELLAKIETAGVHIVYVTLHVGGGTFLPVKVDDISQHVMHSEYAEVSDDTAKIINSAKKEGGRVIAVGTTSVRTLESVADAAGILHKFSGETNIFITPGYKFKLVDMMLTNFHLPKSTLFMLVCAFSGIEKMKKAYAHAIEEKYRFYSYGDACLLFSPTR